MLILTFRLFEKEVNWLTTNCKSAEDKFSKNKAIAIKNTPTSSLADIFNNAMLSGPMVGT